MKIYTEQDIFDAIGEIRPVTTPCGIENISNIIFEKFNLKIDATADDSLNQVIEMMNEQIGVNDVTIRDFIKDICTENLGNEAIKFDDETYTYDQLLDLVQNLSSGLMQKGVKKGSKVALVMTNRIEYIMFYFSLFFIGAYPVPINTRWGKHEIFNVMADAEVDVIVTEDRIGSHMYGEYVTEYVEQNGGNIQVVRINHGDYQKLIELGTGVELKVEEISPNEVAMLSYTSGTTGMPKGVMLKQNDIVKISAYTTQMWRTMEEEYPFSIAPLYSAQGFLSLFIDFAIGKTFKMSSSFNPNDILKEISKCENTVVHTQPTMWSLLLNCRIINFTRFDSLKKMVVSGSLCSPELAKQIEEKIGCTLLNAYGLIEGTSVVTMTRMHDSYDVRMNTVGRPIPGIEIKIVDENRNELPHGEVGELAIKGYNMAGYYHNEEKTNEVLAEDGWLYTGDLAKYYDEENISIVGRCKDMIIRGGFNVYPSDIEEQILQIDGVQNTAVVGNENKILGEEIVAFVLPKAGVQLQKNDIIRPLFSNLANYKIPDKVYFVSEMPAILAGKIDKKLLRVWASEGIPKDKQLLFGA